MSNTLVGTVYQQIIQDVIEASRVDFEEGGVDESVLEELKQGWQKKLSQQQLASFPWDPKVDPPAPAPPAPPPQAAPMPAPAPVAAPNGSNYGQIPVPAQQAQPSQPALSMPMPGGPAGNDPQIKSEPGVKLEPGMENMPAVIGADRNQVQNRVIDQLTTQFGARAAGSIVKLRESISAGQQQPPVPGQPRPAGQPAPQGRPAQYPINPQQYQAHLAAQQAQRAQGGPQGVPNGQKPAPSQMDGAADTESFFGVLLRQNAQGEQTELGRVEIDNMLRAQIEARAKAMEGGGLMLPLKRATKRSAVSYSRAAAGAGGIARFDGGDDDDVKDEDLDDDEEEVDEDAINSDLDDPDENLDDDDDDDEGGQIMLCMYDKVQRVKNKWKCVLKDGVLSVNGRDYVFHKATGEYEW